MKKLGKDGWGLSEMIISSVILLIFLLIAAILIYKFYHELV